MTIKPKIKFTNYITPNPVFIDGISKSGKLIIDTVVSHMDRMEVISMRYITDVLLDFVSIGMLDQNTALEIMGSQIDSRLWKNYIGRDLNTNKHDISSIYNSRDPKMYLERMKRVDNQETYREFKEKIKLENPISPESTDDMFLHKELLLNHFSKLKMIVLFRHPLQIAHSWQRNGRGERYLKDDIRMYQHTYTIGGLQVPEFAIEWAAEYHNISPVDRVLKSVSNASQEYIKSYKNIDEKNEDRIFTLTFEEFVTDPEPYIVDIEKFLGTKRSSNNENIMKNQRIPRVLSIEEFTAKFLELEELSTSKYFNLLLDISREYETVFDSKEKVDEIKPNINLEDYYKYLNEPKFVEGKAIWE